MDPTFAELLRCPDPHCRSEAITGGPREFACRQCRRIYAFDPGGYLDLLDSTAAEPTAATLAQRFMQSELVARLYERAWRPFFVRLFAGSGAGAAAGGFGGEFFIHKNSLSMDDRKGPWLDLSCGPGLFTRAMAAADAGASVVGLDISRPMLLEAAKRTAAYANVTLVRADAHDLPFAEGRFAGVNNAGALHIYDDPEVAFSEIFRVLRPGGLYVGSTFAEATRLVGRLASRLTGIRRFDPPELRAWLSGIGFADYEEIRFADAFIFRARKP